MRRRGCNPSFETCHLIRFPAWEAVTVAKSTPPKHRRQRRKGCADAAFVELSGRKRYLGIYGSPGSKERYSRLLAEWAAHGRQLPVSPDEITVVELAARFWRHAQTFYRKPDGTPTSTLHNYKAALRLARRLYGSSRVQDFTPRALKTVREEMVRSGWCRGTVNQVVNLLRGVFRWGVSEGLVPVEVHAALTTVASLRSGRTEAKDHEPVAPVPEVDVEAVKPHVSRQVRALIDLQLWTGTRPGELVLMRAIDLNTEGEVWAYQVTDHKNSHHGHRRTIYLGPRAQQVLSPFMTGRAIDAHLFDPREAEGERRADTATYRRPGKKPPHAGR